MGLLSVCPVSNFGVLWPNGWMDQVEIWMEVGLAPGHIVVDGDPAPLAQRGTAPNFRPMSVVAKQLDGSRCHLVGGRPRPRRHCVSWGIQLLHKKGEQPPHTFRPMSIVAKRAPISATAEHLFKMKM